MHEKFVNKKNVSRNKMNLINLYIENKNKTR